MTVIGALTQPVSTLAATLGGIPAIVHSGTAQGAADDSLTLAAAASAVDDYYKWMRVRITGGPGAGQERVILASRSNHLPYAEDFRNTAEAGGTRPWINSGVDLTADSIAAPDGNTTADLLIAATTTNRHTRYQTPTITDKSDDLSNTVYGRHSAGAIYLTVYIAEGGFQGANRFGKTFDLQTGTVAPPNAADDTGTAVLLSSAIVDAGGGWWQATVRGNLGASGSSAVSFAYAVNNGFGGGSIGSTWLGDGTSGLYLWGAHGNVGAAPEFYIPTLGGAAVGIQIDRPWIVRPDATSTYEIYLPGATAVGALSQP